MSAALWVATALALGAPDERIAKPAAGPNLDGKYLVVYAEQGGRRNNSWEQQPATIKGNVLTYEDEGKQRSVQFKTGPNQTLTATSQTEGKTYRGVYIAGQEYLCISLSKAGGAPRGEAGTGAAPDREPAPAAGAAHRSSGDFILILRRQRTK